MSLSSAPAEGHQKPTFPRPCPETDLHPSGTYALWSRYLLKASEAKWEDGCISIEAGSGMATLARLLEHNPNLFHDLTPKDGDKNKSLLAARIYSYVQ
jgi:hypothetical protein